MIVSQFPCIRIPHSLEPQVFLCLLVRLLWNSLERHLSQPCICQSREVTVQSRLPAPALLIQMMMRTMILLPLEIMVVLVEMVIGQGIPHQI